jgi:hypothetical protein
MKCVVRHLRDMTLSATLIGICGPGGVTAFSLFEAVLREAVVRGLDNDVALEKRRQKGISGCKSRLG